MGTSTEVSLAVVALSGGMDSCVTAATAAEANRLALLHVTYGQRTARRERRAFDEIADFYGVPGDRRLVADVGYLRDIGGSSLTDPNIPITRAGSGVRERVRERERVRVRVREKVRVRVRVRSGGGESCGIRQAHAAMRLSQGGGVPNSYVPFRNTHILSIAVSWAEVIGAGKVYIGAVEQDSSGYPDCRAAYFEAFQKLADAGTKPGTMIRIETPVIRMSKADIVRRGVELGAPLHLTWSCYQNEELACGTCESCVLRLRAFEVAGIPDPVAYVVRRDG